MKSILPEPLAQDLVTAYFEIRRDVATATLGRSGAGKFVETLVQVLQHLDHGGFDAKPDVDAFLRNADNLKLEDDLRICVARLARAMYSLRNKRNIAHKGPVDPNTYDLRLLLAGAQCCLAELLRHCTGLSMEEAGRLLELVHAPVSALVEEYEKKKLVLSDDVSAREELLVLLHNAYPEPVEIAALLESTNRRQQDTVRKALRGIYADKLTTRTESGGHRLSQRGYREAETIVKRLLAAQ